MKAAMYIYLHYLNRKFLCGFIECHCNGTYSLSVAGSAGGQRLRVHTGHYTEVNKQVEQIVEDVTVYTTHTVASR